MLIISILISFLSFILANNKEPFHSYKHDKSYKINNINLSPVIDGKLDDDCWEKIESITSFMQLDPIYNASPTEKTEVKIFQDQYAIYIGATLFDKTPNLIAQKFVNRDDFANLSKSDWFSISIDSYHDHQTGYTFIVNAAGVQFDILLFDDTFTEPNWDGVWESMVSTDDKGWVVEMRIPFSSLRFSNEKDNDESIWGIDINRYIHRKNEDIEWVILPKGTIAKVSKFGHITNIKDIQKETIIEFIPYLSMGQLKYDDILLKDKTLEDSNKKGMYKSKKFFYYPKVGADIKLHLANNTILDFTSFPDFGQIASDPADINFTYYDTYVEERRFFFLENTALFDTPIDLFHTRRIGENPNYGIDTSSYSQSEDALVLGATKLTGKTIKGLSYGLVAAKTASQQRLSSSNSIFTLNSNMTDYHDYYVGRLSKDFLSGNSYAGLMLTKFKSANKTSTVISYDGLYNLLNNNLYIDSQIARSINQSLNLESESGDGISFEVIYSIPNFMSFTTEVEYFDEDFDVNDIGYFKRNDILKSDNLIIYTNDKNLSTLGFRNFKIIFNHVYAQNNKAIQLLNAFSSRIESIFNNYNWFDIQYDISFESYKDRLYDFTQDSLFLNKVGKIPQKTNSLLAFGNNPDSKLYFDFSFLYSYSEIRDKEIKYDFIIGSNISKDSDFLISYSILNAYEVYRFLEEFLDPLNGLNHFIFSNSNNFQEIFSLRYKKFFQNGINIQLYHEYLSKTHKFSNYHELVGNAEYPRITDWILEDDFYCGRSESVKLEDLQEICVLNPNEYIPNYSKYNELNLNLILSWEYSRISNIYFIYKIKKAIIGKELGNYFDFISYKTETNDLSEIWNDQSIYIKIDYWFDI